MTEVAIHPAFALVAGGVLAAVLRGRFASMVMVIAPVFGFYTIYQLEPGAASSASLFGFELTTVSVDKLSLLFGYLFIKSISLIIILFDLFILKLNEFFIPFFAISLIVLDD